MSDFTSNFWPVFITAISLLGIFGCALLLWRTSKIKVESSSDGTSGHVWDEDLREMNKTRKEQYKSSDAYFFADKELSKLDRKKRMGEA